VRLRQQDINNSLAPRGHSVRAEGGEARRVLITGTSGFVGSHVAALFIRRGYAVFGLDVREPGALSPAGVRHYSCNLLDRAATARVLEEVRPAIVLHLAARTDLAEQRDIAAYAANTEGVESLCDAIARAGTVQRAICTSSQLVNRIGHQPTGDEDYSPNTLYGESKVLTERIWRSRDGAGTTWTIVRPTTIWGPGMNPHYLTFFNLLRSGRYFHVSGGPTLKTYGYVGNTAHQYAMIVEAGADRVHQRVLNLADYEPIALQAWAEEFRQQLDGPPIRTLPFWAAKSAAIVGDLLNALGARSFPFNSFRLNNVTTPHRADVEETRAVCGPLPYTTSDGIARTARWIRDALREQGMADAHAW
jgi:nucleoside-diphosphate-sugar epimerase